MVASHFGRIGPGRDVLHVEMKCFLFPGRYT